jgi:hypothetical protein
MTRTQRRAHAITWSTLALLFTLAAGWALALRASRPVETIPDAIRHERGLP